MAGNEEMIIALDRARMTAMAEKNIGFLRSHLCGGLIYTHSSARMDTKASLIANMENGSTVYTSVVPSDVVAQDLGGRGGADRHGSDFGDVGRGAEFVRGALYRCLPEPGRDLADGDLAIDQAAGVNSALVVRLCGSCNIPLNHMIGGNWAWM